MSANRCLTVSNCEIIWYIYDIIGFIKSVWVEFNNNGVIRKKNNGACSSSRNSVNS